MSVPCRYHQVGFAVHALLEQPTTRDAPATPLRKALSADEQAVWKGWLLPPDICIWVVWLAPVAGFRRSQRRPVPGNEVLSRAFAKMKASVCFQQLTRPP